MDDNSLLVIILAFILGYMFSGMMKQMCGGRLVEGETLNCSDLGKNPLAPINCSKMDSEYTCTMCDQGNYGEPVTMNSSITDTTQNFKFDMYKNNYDDDMDDRLDVIKVICDLNDINCDTNNNNCTYNCSYTEDDQTLSITGILSRNNINNINTMHLDLGKDIPVPVEYMDINWPS